jgi:hypothetical protein
MEVGRYFLRSKKGVMKKGTNNCSRGLEQDPILETTSGLVGIKLFLDMLKIDM